MSGRIELVLGPMFAGKSTELLRRMRRYSIHKRVAVVKPRVDTRYDAIRVSTHDDVRADARALDTLAEMLACVDEFDVVLVDEGQFFPDLADAADQLANAGKIVVVSALSGDFLRRPFPQVALLISLAEHVETITAVCACGEDAPFSARRGAADGDQVVKVGGAETYAACCRQCWTNK